MSDVNTHEEGHQHEGGITTKRIWGVFWVLLAITIVEVIYGMNFSHHIHEKWVNALFFLIMTFVKAGIIVAEFMHLRYEIKTLIRSILIPLLLFVWFVIAFCMDGASWWSLRDQYLPGDKYENAKQKVETPPAENPGVLK